MFHKKVLKVLQNYFSDLSSQFGNGWNRFWFTPASPAPLGLVRLVMGIVAIRWYLSFYPDLQFFFGPNGIIDAQTVEQWRGPNPVLSIFDLPQSAASLWFTYWVGLAVLVLVAAGLFCARDQRGCIDRRRVARPSRADAGSPDGGRAGDGDGLPLHRSVRRRLFRWIDCGGSGVHRLSEVIAVPGAFNVGANIALRLIQVHLALLHFAMAIGQLRDDSWWMGRAIWGFIGKQDSGYLEMTWLSDHIYLLNLWTHGIVIFEFAFALLIWNRPGAADPIRRRGARLGQRRPGERDGRFYAGHARRDAGVCAGGVACAKNSRCSPLWSAATRRRFLFQTV